MGLFSGKNTKNRGGSATTGTPDAPAGATPAPAPENAAKRDESARSSLAANMKKLSKASGSAANAGKRGPDRAGQDRGAAPPTGGTTVATIGKSIIIKGDLSGDEDLIIDGKVEGRVQLPNNEITVGADGRITADIEAKSIIVVGQTAGNLTATQRVEVQASGTVDGDIHSPSLQIQEGATVNGNISMTKSPVPARAGDAATATPISEDERKSA